MGYQHVRILRDQIPLGPDLGSSLQVKSPIVEPGLPGTAVELYAINCDLLVLEIDSVGEGFFTGCFIFLKTEIMVAGDDDLVGMGQGVEKIIKINDLFQYAVIAEVSSMDQDVSVGDL